MSNGSSFFGDNLVGQEQWARRGENDAQVAALLTRIGTLETTVAAMANFIKATATGKLIQSATTVGTTNGGGGLTITFPTTFGAVPVVLCMNGDASAKDDVICGITNSLVTAAHFEVVATDSAGGRIGGALLRFNWIAFGAA